MLRFVMPAAQRLLDEHALTAAASSRHWPRRTTAQGRRARIRPQSNFVCSWFAQSSGGREPSRGAQGAAPRRTAPTSLITDATPHRAEEVKPLSMLRRTIAARLVEAQQTAALLTTFNEIDMEPVMTIRKKYKDRFAERHGVKLGFMSFFGKAAVEALRRYPAVNAEIRGDDIVYRHYQDIGIAIGGGKGLVVPVLRNVERMSFADIENAISEFARQAGENRLQPADLIGGTFTISNGGIYGSLLSTPIVNPPQSGILGLHAIQDRPMAIDGNVVIRPMMYVALTYDHRIVDGREAVGFLRTVKEVIEDPARLVPRVVNRSNVAAERMKPCHSRTQRTFSSIGCRSLEGQSDCRISDVEQPQGTVFGAESHELAHRVADRGNIGRPESAQPVRGRG